MEHTNRQKKKLFANSQVEISKQNLKWKMWELLTCHSENPHHPADPSVAQQRHLHGSCWTFPLFPFRLEGSPYPSQKDEQVEEDHDNHTRDVDSHHEVVDWLPDWMRGASNWAPLEGKQDDIAVELKNDNTPP